MWAPRYFAPVYWTPRYWPTEGTSGEAYVPVDLPRITLDLVPSLAWASLEPSWTASGLVASITVAAPIESEAKAEILPVTLVSFQPTAASATLRRNRSRASVRPVTVAEIRVATADIRRNASTVAVRPRQAKVEVDQ